MFLIIVLITMFLTWKYADWRNWKKYHATMLYFAAGNLLYNFVYHDHFLWSFKPDFFNHHIMEIIYSVSVFPLTALIYLSRFPKERKKQVLYISKYILIYFIAELALTKMGMMKYKFGWNIWWSLAFDCMMFPMLILHYKMPLLTYFVSIIIVFIMNWIFPFKLDK